MCPAGGTKTLTRADLAEGSQVTVTTGLGQTTVYRTERDLDPQDYFNNGNYYGGIKHTVTDPAGGQTITLTNREGSQQITYPDGSVETFDYQGDPRWGMLAPYLASYALDDKWGSFGPFTETTTRTISFLSVGFGAAWTNNPPASGGRFGGAAWFSDAAVA